VPVIVKLNRYIFNNFAVFPFYYHSYPERIRNIVVKIVIDPGIWNDTWKKQDALLSIAKNLYEKLYSRGHEVLMTRSRSTAVADEKLRTEFVIVNQADLFIGLYAALVTSRTSCENRFFCRLASNARGEAVRRKICKRMAELPGIAEINIYPLRGAELRAIPAAVVMIQFCFSLGAHQDDNLSAPELEQFSPHVLAEVIEACIADNL
jgi:hypothetical protein